MNNILLKLLCSISIVLYISFPAKAGYVDSSYLLANNNSNTSNSFTRTLVKEANIVYPATLLAHMDESLNYVQKFTNRNRNYLINIYQKGKNFFPGITSVLQRYNLPQELKVLVALESGFNANAVSRAGAVGYWQFMDQVAIEYGLQISNGKNAKGKKKKKKDDRKDLAKSTLAAAKYLSDRCKELNNNILLMVASYNWGIGNVLKAIKKTGKSNPDFWDIKKYMPSETISYVMNFIALNVVFENFDKFVSNNLVFTTQAIEVPISENIGKINTSVAD